MQIFVPDLGVDLLAAEKHVVGKALLDFVKEVVQDVPCVRESFH